MFILNTIIPGSNRKTTNQNFEGQGNQSAFENISFFLVLFYFYLFNQQPWMILLIAKTENSSQNV